MEEEEKNEWGPAGQPSASEQFKKSGYTEGINYEKIIDDEYATPRFSEDNEEQHRLNVQHALKRASAGHQLTDVEKSLLMDNGFDDFVVGGKTQAPLMDALVLTSPFWIKPAVASGLPLLGKAITKHPMKSLEVGLTGLGAADYLDNPQDLVLETLGMKTDTMFTGGRTPSPFNPIATKKLTEIIDWTFNQSPFKKPVTPEGAEIPMMMSKTDNPGNSSGRFITSSNDIPPRNDLADLTLRTARIDPASPYGQKLKLAASRISNYIRQNEGGAYYFDYDLFRDLVSQTDGEDGRRFLELFQSEMSRTFEGVETLVGPTGFRNFDIAMMRVFRPAAEILGLTKGVPGRMDYSNVHHIAALKGLMGIYDKVGFNSPLMKQINDVFYKKLKGLGGQEGNFMRLIGGTSDIGSPHYLAHAFLNHAIGKSGEKFFTPQVLRNMNASDSFRLKQASDLTDIIADSAKVAQKAQDVYKSIADAALAVDYDEVSATLARLMDKDLLKMPDLDFKNYNQRVTTNIAGGKYLTRNFDTLIEDIVEIHKAKPFMSTVDFDALLFNEKDLSALKKTYRLFSELNTKYPHIDFSGKTLSDLIKRNNIGMFRQGSLFKQVPTDVLEENIKELFEAQIKREKSAIKGAKTKRAKKFKSETFDFSRIESEFIDTGELDEFGQPKIND